MEPRRLGKLQKPRPPAAPPPGGVPPQLAGAQAGLPLMPGTVVLTEFEKTELKKHGWKEGDPIPKELPALYAAQQAARAAAEEMPEIDQAAMAAFRPQIAPEQNIRDLPRARQSELAAALQGARVQHDFLQRQQRAQVSGAGPGINDAIAAALQQPVLPPQAVFADEVLVDDLPEKVAAPRQSAPPRAAPPVPPPVPPDDRDLDARPGAGAAEHPANCPHCGWRLDQLEVVVPTDDDRLGWLVAQEGARRFTKDYRLLDGRMVVTFRTLTAKESDMAWRQVAVDGTKDLRGRLPETEDHYWRNLMTYRMVMGVERLWSQSRGPIDNPPVDEWEVDRDACPAPNTRLYAILPEVTEALFPSETLRRQIGNAFHKFQLLVELLEARAEDESFWSGIGPQS